MYKKLRYSLWFATALLKKYRIHVGVGLLVGCLSFFILPTLIKKIPVLRPVQRIGLVGRHSSTELPQAIQKKISIGLTTIAENSEPAPGLAKSWEASEDGKVYTFTINRDLYWHDGTQVKSSDISYTFKDATIEYPDDDHLVIKLTDPFAALPTVVSKPVTKTGNKEIIGVGKYHVDTITYNGALLEAMTLVSSDQSLPILKYSFYTTQSLARTAFKLGLIDSIIDITDITELSDWPNVTVRTDAQIDRYVAVFFNTDDPNFIGAGGKNLRLALAYATQKPTGTETRAIGPISPLSWAYNPDIKPYDYDAARSKELLKKVDKIPSEIVITTLPAYLPLAEKVQQDWQTVGINTKIQVSQDIPDTFSVLIVAQAMPIDPDQYNLWHSTQAQTNLTALKNPRIDKLLEDGRKTLDVNERKKIYADFQKYLVEESPAIFLLYPKTYSIFRK